MKRFLFVTVLLLGMPSYSQPILKQFATTNGPITVSNIISSIASSGARTNWPVSSITNAGTASYSNSSAFVLSSAYSMPLSGDPVLLFDAANEIGQTVINRAFKRLGQNINIGIQRGSYRGPNIENTNGGNFSIDTLTNYADPVGGFSADWLNYTNPANNYIGDNFTIPVAGTYTISIWAQSSSGTNESARFYLGGYSSPFTISTNWQRFKYSATLSAGSQLVVFISTASSTNSLSAYIWGSQLEFGASATPVQNNVMDGMLGDYGTVDSSDPSRAVAWISFTNSQFVKLAPSIPLKLLNGASIYALLKRDGVGSLAGYSPVFNNETANPTLALSLDYAAGQEKARFIFGTTIVTSYLDDLFDSGWHTIVATTDRTNYFMWIDDVLMASNSIAAGSSPIEAYRLWLGNLNNAGYFAGKISYFSVYDQPHSFSMVSNNLTALRSVANSRGISAGISPYMLGFEGDSITAAISAPNGGYPAYIYTNLTSHIRANNWAVSGSTIATLTNRSWIVDQAAASVSSSTRTNILCVLDGANDLGVGNTNAFWTSLTNYYAARRAAGWKVVAIQITPRTAAGFNADRNVINALLEANPSVYDALARLSTNTVIGCDSCATNTIYFSDGTHPTAAGQTNIWPIVNAAISRLGIN